MNVVAMQLRGANERMINTKPTMVTLVRVTETDNGYGSIKKGRAEIPAQKMLVSEVSAEDRKALIDEGLLSSHTLSVSAKHNADIVDGDRFVFNGKNYEVFGMNPSFMGGTTPDCIWKKGAHAKEAIEEVK